jgi:hypothetical protein
MGGHGPAIVRVSPCEPEGCATHSRILPVLATVLLGACAAISGLDAYGTGPVAIDASDDVGPSLEGGPSPQADVTASTPEAAVQPEEAGPDAEVVEAASVDTASPVACDAGLNLCDGACIDYSSASNCGSCGHVCTSGVANATAACVASKCTFTCDAGFSLCNGACVNEQTDSNNCGGCGSAHACATGLSCQSGMCALSQASPACSACLLANCSSMYTAVDADPLAIAVANCGLENKCVNTCCFCSGGPCASCTGYGDGPCRAVIEMAAGVESPSVCATDGPTLSANCENSSNSCGKANALATCEAAMCQSQCMAAACN